MRVARGARELQMALRGVCGAGRLECLRALQTWFERAAPLFDQQVLLRLRFEHFTGVDLSVYPVERSSLDFWSEISCDRVVNPRSERDFLDAICEIFWAGTTVCSIVECPACPVEHLQMLEDPADNSLVLACDECAWAQTTDGRRWTGGSWLRPASRSLIEANSALVR